MFILYVDDEALAINRFELCIAQADPTITYKTFSQPEEALAFAEHTPFDAAFLDVEMPGLTGVELARRLVALQPGIRLFFVTAYEQYALEAFGVDAMGYLLKPYSVEKLRQALEKASRMRDLPTKKVYIQTIPDFDVFVDGKLLPFTAQKPKELLAFLVDRNGSAATAPQIIASLWEDKPDDESTKSLYRMTFKRLKELLNNAGIGFILPSEGSQKYINPESFQCDYFECLKGNEDALAKYAGDYMTSYSWAEQTNARLFSIKNAL